jgi:hypothetical protein
MGATAIAARRVGTATAAATAEYWRLGPAAAKYLGNRKHRFFELRLCMGKPA